MVKRCVEQRTALSDDEHLGGLDVITPDPLMHEGRPVPLTRIRGRIGRLVIPILDVVGDERQRYDDLIGVTGYWNLHDAYELRQAAIDLPVEGRAEGSGQSQASA